MPAKIPLEDIEIVKSKIKLGLTNVEIAKSLGWTRAKVAIIAQRKCGGNPNYRDKKTKHKHLRKDVLEAFQNMTAKDAAEKFGMTMSEFKSCLTVAYKMSELSHIRKDTRTHRKWEVEEIITMLKYCGILSRDEIAKIINRQHSRVIKEKLNWLGVSSRNINGINLGQFKKLFGRMPEYQIRGRAGPRVSETNFVIVPWFHVVESYSSIPHDKTLLEIFRCYAKFQSYIWRSESVWRKMRADKRISSFLLQIDNLN